MEPIVSVVLAPLGRVNGRRVLRKRGSHTSPRLDPVGTVTQHSVPARDRPERCLPQLGYCSDKPRTTQCF